MKPGDEPRETAAGREADDDKDELVARVREAWAQYQQRSAGDPTREAVALPPLLTALLRLIS